MRVPEEVQSATGRMYTHVPVYTMRLVMREGPGGEYMMAEGTVYALLGYIPVRDFFRVDNNRRISTSDLGEFRRMCHMVRDRVLPRKPDSGAYAWEQWCIAVLARGSTMESGRCRLIAPVGDRLRTRDVDSLYGEMERMGMKGERKSPKLHPLPAPSNSPSVDNRSIVTVPRVVDLLGISYEIGQGGLARLAGPNGAFCIQSQSIDVHRAVAYDSPALLQMCNGFRSLWKRSFDLHACYAVCENEVLFRFP
jgi:hypothetical protein